MADAKTGQTLKQSFQEQVDDGALDSYTKTADLPATLAKASGAEVTTGTNDAKFVTPKAIKDAALVTIEKAEAGSAIVPIADGTYTPVTITVVKGIITAVTE